MSARQRPVLRRLLVASVAALVATATVAPAPASAAIAGTPTLTWTPTTGRVYAVARVGTAIVVGGTFTALWSPNGATTVARNRLAAFCGSVPAMYSCKFEKPSWSGSCAASLTSLFKPLASSQSSGIPSPSVSVIPELPAVGAAAIQLAGSFP